MSRATTIDAQGRWVFEKQANKYGAKPVSLCLNCLCNLEGLKPGICCDRPQPQRFASGLEASRYIELSMLQQCGDIDKLRIQVPYDFYVNGQKICGYKADFVYFDKHKKGYVVEDTKSKATKTPEYLIKKRLMRALYHIEVIEVYAK